jgi:hypothetical protein
MTLIWRPGGRDRFTPQRLVQKLCRSDLVLTKGRGDVADDEIVLGFLLDFVHLLLDVFGHGRVLNRDLVCMKCEY